MVPARRGLNAACMLCMHKRPPCAEAVAVGMDEPVIRGVSAPEQGERKEKAETKREEKYRKK